MTISGIQVEVTISFRRFKLSPLVSLLALKKQYKKIPFIFRNFHS